MRDMFVNDIVLIALNTKVHKADQKGTINNYDSK